MSMQRVFNFGDFENAGRVAWDFRWKPFPDTDEMMGVKIIC